MPDARKMAARARLYRGQYERQCSATLNAKNNEVAIETLEICHEGLVVEWA